MKKVYNQKLAIKGTQNGFYGKKHSPEAIAKLII